MNMSYNIPIEFTLADINSISEVEVILQNVDIFAYKI